MDIDLPVYTQVRKAYTEEDKNQFKKEGRCFNCDKQGHMAQKCPDKKYQSYQSQFKPKFDQAPQSKGKFTSQPKQSQGFRKCNKPSLYFKGYTLQIWSAQIKEIEEEDDKNEDPYDLAARTVHLDEEQCKK
jgi:hypothetical protein